MNFKKIILLSIFVFILTGCNAEYNLVYEDGKVSESLDVISLEEDIMDGQSFSSLVENYYDNTNLLVNYKIQPGDMSEKEYLNKYEVYNKHLINNENYGINLNYDYKNYKDYSNSSIVNTLFSSLFVSETSFQAYNAINIFENYSYLDKIVISFKTDREVLEHNCDRVENNVYYWEVTKDNYLNKTVKMSLSKDKKIVLSDDDYDSLFKIIFISLGVILLIIGFVIFVKVKNSNKK